MNEEQSKALAALVLSLDERMGLNDERILSLHQVLDNLIEEILPLLPPDTEWKSKRSMIESLIERQEAITLDSNKLRENLRKLFGLDQPET